EIARHAARMLIASLRPDAPPVPNQGFVPQLVVRGSTAPVRPRAPSPANGEP
ncbi:MAG: LacI family transcriptional regulator, partial [Xanthomonadaceae bacterium]|nr:LacI family transcriptional regulator [Xanthomonadaceae bacterium]